MTDQDTPEPVDTCRPVDIDGETIRVRGAEELSDEGHAALAELVQAAKRRMEAEQAERGPKHPRALAFNVVGSVLRERGDWLRLTTRRAVADAVLAELKPELDALAALRAVARGYCPACGRGDAAPTVEDWEQQRQRAEQAEQRLRRIADGHPRADAIQAEIGEMIAQTHELREQLRLADAMRQQNLDAAAAAVQRAETAERERGTARQHAAAIAAQRDRLRQRMNTLADRWETALPGQPHHGFAQALRKEISVAPFHGEHTAVQQYRADDGSQKWAARCWGTETCDGWLSLDHDTERWAEIARDRHVAETHAEEPGPA